MCASVVNVGMPVDSDGVLLMIESLITNILREEVRCECEQNKSFQAR